MSDYFQKNLFSLSVYAKTLPLDLGKHFRRTPKHHNFAAYRVRTPEDLGDVLFLAQMPSVPHALQHQMVFLSLVGS